MTLKEAKARLNSMGFTVSNTGNGNFKMTRKGGTDAWFNDRLEDLVKSARAVGSGL